MPAGPYKRYGPMSRAPQVPGGTAPPEGLVNPQLQAGLSRIAFVEQQTERRKHSLEPNARQELARASEDQLRDAIKKIEKLNPKPGSAFSEPTKINSTIIPDFKIEIIENKLTLNLNSRNAPELYVSNEYKNMLTGYQENKNISKSKKQAVTFIKQKLDSAKWFIDAINQRNQTLLITMKTIMEFQSKYFLSGDESNLKPMILKDIAEKIGMDISTISRVANSKYVDTPYGIKLIKTFFSEGITNDKGIEVSTIEIKKELQNIINGENKSKPLTDDELTKKINDKGYPIARRTVAKYREMIGAPVARLRKKL